MKDFGFLLLTRFVNQTRTKCKQCLLRNSNGDVPSLLKDILEVCVVDEDIGTVVQTFEKIFDPEESTENSRFVVKHGVDPSLDEKKKFHNGLPDLLHQLVQDEVSNGSLSGHCRPFITKVQKSYDRFKMIKLARLVQSSR